MGTPVRVGTSALAAASGFDVAGFAVELAVTPEDTLVAEAVAGLAVLIVPTAGFGPDPGTVVGFAEAVLAGFGRAVLAGFAIVFAAAALAGEFGAEVAFELGTADAGFATELVDGAGFVVCACLGVAVPVEA